jgi:hypothetical protein
MPGLGEGSGTASGVGAQTDPGGRPALRVVEDSPCILVAGGDPRLRAEVRRELAVGMAPGTLFEEAGMVWEVLQQAPRSGLVMLTGDLRDASVEGLSRLLAQRHPRLPIVALDGPTTH